MKALFTLKGNLEIIIKDAKGNIISVDKQPCKSIVVGLMKWLRAWFTVAFGNTSPTAWSMIDTGGSNESYPWVTAANYGRHGAFNAPLNTDTYGIVIGTVDTPVTPQDYLLSGKVANATMRHNAQSGEDVTSDVNSCGFTFVRQFDNISGSTQTIKEVGLTVAINNAAGNQKNTLCARDVLATPKVVINGNSMTVRYIFRAYI